MRRIKKKLSVNLNRINNLKKVKKFWKLKLEKKNWKFLLVAFSNSFSYSLIR